MNQEKLFSLKENFTGQKFQWIKTQDPNLMGKVVKCRDVDMFGDKYIVIFDDGSRIDSEFLNRNMMMIHGETQPLTREEVISLNPQPLNKTQQNGKISQNSIDNSQTINRMQDPQLQQNKQNMFTIFNAEESILNLKISVKLPDKKLLKMMYSSTENKQEFMDQLSEYLSSKINKTVVIEAMKQLLEVNQTVRPDGKPQIKIKEINESK
jgi:hypothetical protein